MFHQMTQIKHSGWRRRRTDNWCSLVRSQGSSPLATMASMFIRYLMVMMMVILVIMVVMVTMRGILCSRAISVSGQPWLPCWQSSHSSKTQNLHLFWAQVGPIFTPDPPDSVQPKGLFLKAKCSKIPGVSTLNQFQVKAREGSRKQHCWQIGFMNATKAFTWSRLLD